MRGFVAAFDAESGKEAWRFWTIPAPGEFGSSSWPGESYKLGGGTTWMPGTFDPELNTIFWGTSNPAPDFDGGPRPGDDLYTDCLLALDPDTGKLKWYFQFTPHDLFDYDAVETPVLVDASFAVNLENSSSKRTETAFCTFSIAPMVHFFPPGVSPRNSIGPPVSTKKVVPFERMSNPPRPAPAFARHGRRHKLALAGL